MDGVVVVNTLGSVVGFLLGDRVGGCVSTLFTSTSVVGAPEGLSVGAKVSPQQL